MNAGRLARLARMDASELRWRAGVAGRNAVDRALSSLRPLEWRRDDLLSIVGDDAAVRDVRRAAERRDWMSANRALARAIDVEPPHFVIGAAMRNSLASRIRAAFPSSEGDAVTRADRLVSGAYDLLGYTGLRFDTDHGSPDWHFDPVHQRRAPRQFWSTVRYLDPACGDHKVIWELNRQQHLLALGRAYWLTDDVTYKQAALDSIASWIRANPPLLGINWASMLELAFRGLSWTWALHFFGDDDGENDAWRVDLFVALDRHLRQIARNLSHYFSPNTHLLGEALALYVAGSSFPWLRSARDYVDSGRRVLLNELTRQVGADGGHLERSTHYHRYTLDFYLLALVVSRITEDPASEVLRDAVARLASAARLLADDQGRMPHLGDDDGGMLLPLCGRAPDDVSDSLAIAAALLGRPDLRVDGPPEEAMWMLAHPALRITAERTLAAPSSLIRSGALPQMGYYVSRSSAGEHLVVDAGAHGMGNSGHAHADALSLTLTVGALPLFIDPGTAFYTVDPSSRDRFRSSALHNTVVVDGRTQSLPAGPFHWQRTANGVAHVWRTHSVFDYLEASHDGYAPLEHRRHVLAVHGDLLVIADLVDGEGRHDMLVHWHLDPNWIVERASRRVLLRNGGEHISLAVSRGSVEAVSATADVGWHAPVYGRVEPTTTLRVSMSGQAPLWVVTAISFDPGNPVTSVDPLPIHAEAGAFARTHAVRIERSRSIDLFGLAAPIVRAAADGVPAGPSGDIWRAAHCESDARVLLCSSGDSGSRVILVDGSTVRANQGCPVHVRLPEVVSDLHLDLSSAGGKRASG